MKNITELNDSDFDSTLKVATLPVLVDFHATWCGPCRMLAPVLEDLAGQMAGEVQFAKVDVDEAPQAAMRFGIHAVPTLMVFREGQLVDKLEGFLPPHQLKAWLREAAAAKPVA